MSFFLLVTMSKKRRVQKLITAVLLPTHLATSSATSHRLFDLGAAISLLSTLYRCHSRVQISYPLGKFGLACIAIGGKSYILPDFVYLAVLCVYSPSPLFYELCCPQLRSAQWQIVHMFINIPDMHPKSNIYSYFKFWYRHACLVLGQFEVN